MKREVKSRKHILCEKAPLVAMILAAALALVVLTIPGLVGLSGVADNLASSVLAVLFMECGQRNLKLLALGLDEC